MYQQYRKFLLFLSVVILFFGFLYNLIIGPLVLIFLLLCIGTFKPALISPLYNAWMFFGVVLGRFFSPIVLSILFFFIVTPYAIFGRLLGRDELSLRVENGSPSYWSERKMTHTNFDEQF